MASYGSGGESDEEDFNPAPEIDDDDVAPPKPSRRQVADDDDDEEDEEDVAPTRTGNDEEDEEGGGIDLDNEDDDEEDEDEDDDDEDVVARPAKRRKKARRNMFIDVEAEVDEEEEEEEEGDDDGAEEVHPDDLLEPTGADLDDRHHRELDMRREANEHKDAEEMAREFEEKYRRREVQSAKRGAAGAIPLELPTINDPAIYGFKCRPGKEKEIIMAVQKRIDDKVRTKQRVAVYSVFERGPTGPQSGFIYVEADSSQDASEMVEGVINVFMGTKPFMIEAKERPDLLRKKKKAPLEVGNFVRMLRPPTYRGDLAKLMDVSPNGLDCIVQLVPRLDYGLNEDANAAIDNKRKRGFFGRTTERPPAKLFNEAEAKKKHMKHLTMSGSGNQRQYTYKGETYENGFLIKDAKVNWVSTERVNPKMEELQFFSVQNADGTETMDLLAVQAAQKAVDSGAAFASGDNVEIYTGEQKGIRGTTVTVTGDILTLRVSEGELRGRRIDAPVKTLRKLFRDGDHVKVIGGSRYVDEVGLVTRIKDDKITLLCDSTQEEITVFSKDLKRAADSATLGADSNFDLYDIVQIDASTMGIVVKVDREVLRVLDQNAETRSLLHTQVSQLGNKNRNAVATDRDGSEIRLEDDVKEYSGENRTGKVMHIHRGTLFVQNRELVENQGVFVVRSSNVVTLAAKGSRNQAQGPDLSGLNPALNAGANGGAGGMPPPRSMGRDRMIGKTVTVRKGMYKGLLGIVKDTMGGEARVELHTKNKQVSIPKDLLSIKDPITGATLDFGGNKFANRSRGGGYGGGGNTAYGGAGGRTPGWGTSSARGPSWGSTPAGGRTPGWGGGGGRTPGWGGEGGRTAYGDGSRTAYGGDGSRTAYGGGATAYGGATSYGGSTSYGANDGNRTAYGGFNSGARTPGWGGAGATTSKSSGGLSAPTPGAYSAPTPGAYAAPTPGGYGAYSAPTPGGPPMDAPTPGNYSAPTPGDTTGGRYGATPAAAPTPGGWDVATPAPSGDDPRYD